MFRLGDSDSNEFEVFGTWVDREEGNYQSSIGEVTLDVNNDNEPISMPDEIEIDGRVYKLEV